MILFVQLFASVTYFRFRPSLGYTIYLQIQQIK